MASRFLQSALCILLFSTLHITGVYYQSVNETSVLNYNNSKPQQLSTYALTLFQYKTRVDGTDVRVGKSNLTCSLPICVLIVFCLHSQTCIRQLPIKQSPCIKWSVVKVLNVFPLNHSNFHQSGSSGLLYRVVISTLYNKF